VDYDSDVHGSQQNCVSSMELASCYPSGAKNFDMEIRFFKSFAPLFGVIKEHEMLVAEFTLHYLWRFKIC